MEANIIKFSNQSNYSSDLVDFDNNSSAIIRPINEVYGNGEIFKTNNIVLNYEESEVSEQNLKAFYQKKRNTET